MTTAIIKGAHQPHKSIQSRMDTLIITPEMVNQWKVPDFQRPIRLNCAVQMLTEKIKENEVIEGVLTLGALKSAPTVLYIVDGQHRVEGFRLSGLQEAIADIRVVTFDDMAEMADEFVNLNTALVRMRPDDILRGLENSLPNIKNIRKTCEYVGYDNIRRNTNAPIVSMSALLRSWRASQNDTPASNGGMSAAQLARNLDVVSMQNMIGFLDVAHVSWGRDPENYRLWANLNFTMCAWLWNKMVVDRDRGGAKRYSTMTIPDFKKCLMSVSASADYLSWLTGRTLSDRDRSPSYTRLRAIFTKRMADENLLNTLGDEETNGKKFNLPSPPWWSAKGS